MPEFWPRVKANWDRGTTPLRLFRWRRQAYRILERARQLESLSDRDLLNLGRGLKWDALAGRPLSLLLPRLYPASIEATRRTFGFRHFPVQIMGALALFDGGIAEMQTGEGKTITAVLPAALHALCGRGCHVVTVNDYLARRDADQLRPIFEQLGLSVGCIQGSQEPPERKLAYKADVTYATAKELGFDFLRDRLRKEQPEEAGNIVQRGCHFALVDEADSIMIDEARTPLIIALPQPNDAARVNLYRWSARMAATLESGRDFSFSTKERSVALTERGCRAAVLLEKPAALDSLDTEVIYLQLERALLAQHGFARNRDYIVNDQQEVVIVDESTGRLMEGRRWQEGLHQAVEAREMLPITAATAQAARITVQSFFRQYTHLAGMTGTVTGIEPELRSAYGLRVTKIPTCRPSKRKQMPTRVFSSRAEKLSAVAESIRQQQATGRAILVGTPSVHQSEQLGAVLEEMGISHEILNAKHHAREAEIISQAGQPGRVTIATNMAGRGTDILLADEVRSVGGLHVIATEMHSSQRIDRQLVGRCGRQGDPGSFQVFLSLEDELLQLPGGKGDLSTTPRGERSASAIRIFRHAQQTQESLYRKQRRSLLKQETSRREHYERMGLDPYVELTD